MDKTENWEVARIQDNQRQFAETTPINQILMQNQNELALIVISPTLIKNNDFVYIIDNFSRQKFNIAGVKKTQLEMDDLKVLFKDLAPRVHSLEALHTEFKRGESVLLVLEKPKAIVEAEQLIGKFSIKLNSDYEKKKRMKKTTFQFNNSYGGAKAEEDNMVSEFGSYIFCFPNA